MCAEGRSSEAGDAGRLKFFWRKGVARRNKYLPRHATLPARLQRELYRCKSSVEPNFGGTTGRVPAGGKDLQVLALGSLGTGGMRESAQSRSHWPGT